MVVTFDIVAFVVVGWTVLCAFVTCVACAWCRQANVSARLERALATGAEERAARDQRRARRARDRVRILASQSRRRRAEIQRRTRADIARKKRQPKLEVAFANVIPGPPTFDVVDLFLKQ
jgi:hypothetical protein